jgi:hypothetical protein
MNPPSSPASPAENGPVPARRSGIGRRLLRWIVLVLLALVVGGALGLGTTANGRAAAQAALRWLDEQIHAQSLAAAEQEAVQQLRQRGALVMADLPGGHVSSVNFLGKPIDDEALRHLAALHWVQSVDVSRTNIRDEQLRCLEPLGYLAALSASATHLTDEGMDEIARLGALEQLVITETRIGDDGLRRIARARNLVVLDLCHTRVTDAGVAALVGMPRLRQLVLDSDDITDAAIADLEKIPSLRQVELRGSRVTAEGQKRMERALQGFMQ